MSAGPKTLLVVEDDEDIREALRDVFEASGYGVTLAANAKHARA